MNAAVHSNIEIGVEVGIDKDLLHKIDDTHLNDVSDFTFLKKTLVMKKYFPVPQTVISKLERFLYLLDD